MLQHLLQHIHFPQTGFSVEGIMFAWQEICSNFYPVEIDIKYLYQMERLTYSSSYSSLRDSYNSLVMHLTVILASFTLFFPVLRS